MKRLSLDEMYECARTVAAMTADATPKQTNPLWCRHEIAEAMKRVIDERREACRKPRTSSTT